MYEPPPFQSTLVARLHVQLGAVQEIGTLTSGRRRVVPVLGGRVSGPRLSGEVLAGGADWQIVAADGSATIEARYTVRASDGSLILAHSRGMRNGPSAVLARLAAGDPVDPREYYFRTVVTLETGAPSYSWVNHRLFIAVAAREPAAVLIDLHEIA